MKYSFVLDEDVYVDDNSNKCLISKQSPSLLSIKRSDSIFELFQNEEGLKEKDTSNENEMNVLVTRNQTMNLNKNLIIINKPKVNTSKVSLIIIL